MIAQYDVVVVGAGPIGGYLSRRFCEHGHSVLLIEEHSEVGRPFQCAGLVNPGAMVSVGLENTVLTGIWGARIHGPSGSAVEIGDPSRIRTWSVCRKLFDEAVVLQAINKGAKLLLSSKPTSATVHAEHVSLCVDTPDGDLQVNAKLLCGADGAHSWVRRRFRMGYPKEQMIGFQVEVTGYHGEDGKLDVYTGSEFAPGFFAWAIPSGETTRIGTWTKADLLNGRSCEDLLSKLQSSHLWSARFDQCRPKVAAL